MSKNQIHRPNIQNRSFQLQNNNNNDIDKFLESSKTLEMSKKKLDELETRWLELDLQKNKL